MSNKTNLVQRPLLRYGCFQRLRHSSSSLTIIREADDCPRNMLHTLPQTKGVELCRLKHHYDSILRYDLMQKLIIQNTHQTPKLEKIILSASVSFKPQQVRGPGVQLGSAQQSRSSKSKATPSEAKLSNAAATNKKNIAN